MSGYGFCAGTAPSWSASHAAGVVLAREIAGMLDAPLDVLLIGKIDAPERPGTDLAAVGKGGVLITNHDAAARLGVTPAELRQAANRERAALTRRMVAFRRECRRTPVGGRTVLLVDDGVTTGATARAAIRVLRARGAGRIVLAVPFAPVDALSQLDIGADQTVYLCRQPCRQSVHSCYAELPPFTDAAVIALLKPVPDAESVPA